MKENKTDARVIKTKQRIEATFLRMLAEMPFEKLTTTLLIKECLISKGTFYAHYLDKYDLAEQLIDRELQLFETLLTQRFENKQTSLEQLSQMVTKRFLLKFTLNILYSLGCTVDRKWWSWLESTVNQLIKKSLSV